MTPCKPRRLPPPKPRRLMPTMKTVDIGQASEMTGHSVEDLRQMVRDGVGPRVTQCPFTGERRHLITDVERWLEAREASHGG